MFTNDKELHDTLITSISILKKSYDELPIQEKTFLDYLKHTLGYLAELVDVMQKNKKTPYFYQSTDESKSIYARFFCESYDKAVFDSEEEFNDYRSGFNGAKELINIQPNEDKSFHFSIRNQLLLNYLYCLHPCEVLNNKIRSIVDFIENRVPAEELTISH